MGIAIVTVQNQKTTRRMTAIVLLLPKQGEVMASCVPVGGLETETRTPWLVGQWPTACGIRLYATWQQFMNNAFRIKLSYRTRSACCVHPDDISISNIQRV